MLITGICREKGFDILEKTVNKIEDPRFRLLVIGDGEYRAAFEKNGIAHMPLKGILMKQLYPRPDMRIMGDADILIRVEQYEKIKPLLEELGFAEKLESDHELICRCRYNLYQANKLCCVRIENQVKNNWKLRICDSF